MQAFPAGLVAVLAGPNGPEPARLLQLWQQRRQVFHRRYRLEIRFDLRLAREVYGYGLKDVAPILGYTPREYQKIEAGVEPLLDSARARILGAIHQAGQRRIDDLLRHRQALQAQQDRWSAPASVSELIALLAQREGGLAPLARRLRHATPLRGLTPVRLRAIIRGKETPAWCVLAQLGRTCGVEDLSRVYLDWLERFRAQLAQRCPSPLGVEMRLLVGEVAPSLRAWSLQVGFNYSVLIREFQRIDRDEPIRWYRIERILRTIGLPPNGERWREFRGLWATAATRRKKPYWKFNQ